MKFKKWLESVAIDDRIFGQRDITQKANIGRMLGLGTNLNKIHQGSFATLYQHPNNSNALIKVTSHKSDIDNLVKAQRLKSDNVVKVFKWNATETIKRLPKLNSFAIIVENIDGKPMVYDTNSFLTLSLNGNFELAKNWIETGGNEIQQKVLNYFNTNTEREHEKLSFLFETLFNLRRLNIDLVDFSDNILDSQDRYVIVDMGF